MTKPRPATLLAVDPTGSEPLYRQLYARIQGAIAEGVLKPGDRIPSARALAKELGLARGTIETAYALLGAEGYIQPRGQAGTIVTPGIHLPANTPRPARCASLQPDEAVTAFGDSHPDDSGQPSVIPPFQMGLPAMDAFPRKIWARLGARKLRSMQAPDMSYPSLFGLPALRQALAAYLLVARGIRCTAEQVFITSGYRDTMHFVVQTLLKPGDRVWVEDPGYPPTRELLGLAGLQHIPVPVDAEGIRVQEGVALAANAHAAVVTPAHQSPLSMSMSLPRRLDMLDWAAQTGAWIVEDDYDGEYRYAGRPLPALASLDRRGRVLYAGTFSKVMFPGIRLAYLVVPEEQVRRFREARSIFAPGIPALTQAMVTAFMEEGHFSRHIQRMRKLYAERREVVAAGLMQVLGAHMQVAPQPGGMHLCLHMRGREPGSDQALAARIREQGMYAHALSDWAVAAPVEPSLLLSFTNIATQQRAEALGKRILDLIRHGP